MKTEDMRRVYAGCLVLALLLNCFRGCDCKKHVHHRAHRSRRHHHETSNFFQAGSDHQSESQNYDTFRNYEITPNGHSHHGTTQHKHKALNNHQHHAVEEQTYETKYETTYVKNYENYGDDELHTAGKPYPFVEPGPASEKIAIHPEDLVASDKELLKPNTPLDLLGSHDPEFETEYILASPSKIEPSSTKIKRKEKRKHGKSRNEAHVERDTKKNKTNGNTSSKEPGKDDDSELEGVEVDYVMLNDSPQIWADVINSATKTKKLFSPNALTQKQVSSAGVSANRVVKAHVTGHKQAHKQRNGGAPSRWTLTYQGGGPSESALNNSIVNVTAVIGGDTFLPCRVGHLGDRQISWIRSRDWHVLSSGIEMYTPDRRFTVLHEAGSQDWTLHIKYVMPRDNGTYECQVSTGTGIISLFVNLTVVTPLAHIPGRGQYHVDTGSPIVLTCIISRSPTPPSYVFWYHNGQLLNFLRNRKDFTISLEPRGSRDGSAEGAIDVGLGDGGFPPSSDGTGVASVSKLQMLHAQDRHSGNYTCAAPKTQPASTLVFVTEGDKTAAVQRIDTSRASSAGVASKFVQVLSVLVLYGFPSFYHCYGHGTWLHLAGTLAHATNPSLASSR